jgi:hypothetical protein
MREHLIFNRSEIFKFHANKKNDRINGLLLKYTFFLAYV